MERFDFAAATADREPGAPGLAADLATAALRTALLLEAMLRRPVTGSAGSLRRIRPADVALTGVAAFSIDLGAGPRGVATAPAPFVTGLAEMFMGAPGAAAHREPTPLECNVFASRLNAALDPVVAALPVDALRLAPAAAVAVPATDLVTFELSLSAAEVAGALHLAIPAAHFAGAGIAAAGHDPEPDPALVSALQAVPMRLSVRFGAVRLPGDELERLAVGDVVRLPHPVDQPLVAEVDGQPLFLARPGRRGRRLAVEISDVVEERS